MKESNIFSEKNLTEKVHYVYRVTIDEKHYIGKRSGLLNDLITGVYKTSSKIVQEKLKNGMTFSKIKIIQVFSSSEDALNFEKRILTRVNAKANKKFLNQCNGNSSDFCLKQHSEKTKKKLSKIQKKRWDKDTEEGRKNREIRRDLFLKMYDINTEEGRKNREIRRDFYNSDYGKQLRKNHSQKIKAFFDINTEEGRKNREIRRDFSVKMYDINTEEGRKRRELDRISTNKQFDINTEQGRKNRENHRNLTLKQFDINTEEGRKNRENHLKAMKEYYNPETELGQLHLQENRERQKEVYNINTEEGRRNREKAKERAKVVTQKSAKTRIQKRKDNSILGELIFDEDFIRKNFLIIDNKNNQRFLWSVYSKLTGYSECMTRQLKQNGKISFLSGIKSIKLSEEEENAKIKEIEQLLKSRNNEKE